MRVNLKNQAIRNSVGMSKQDVLLSDSDNQKLIGGSRGGGMSNSGKEFFKEVVVRECLDRIGKHNPLWKKRIKSPYVDPQRIESLKALTPKKYEQYYQGEWVEEFPKKISKREYRKLTKSVPEGVDMPGIQTKESKLWNTPKGASYES